MRLHLGALLATAIATSALTAGCDRIGNPLQALGQGIPPPDEFAVIKRRPLQMPPGLGLPEPRPGAPSPLDPQPRAEAAYALLGTPAPATRAVPGQPMTAGEAALLASADAASASSDVRVQLAREEDTGPYEPPTIFELFGGASPGIDEEERLQPVDEAERLQRTGVLAPSDPRPPSDEEERRMVDGPEDDTTEEGVRVFRAPQTTGRP